MRFPLSALRLRRPQTNPAARTAVVVGNPLSVPSDFLRSEYYFNTVYDGAIARQRNVYGKNIHLESNVWASAPVINKLFVSRKRHVSFGFRFFSVPISMTSSHARQRRSLSTAARYSRARFSRPGIRTQTSVSHHQLI